MAVALALIVIMVGFTLIWLGWTGTPFAEAFGRIGGIFGGGKA